MKSFVNQKITTLTTQPSEIKGAINWQLFPHPGIKIENICIGNQTAQSPCAIKLGQLLFNLKISALLQGKIVFNEIKIDNVTAVINLNKKPPLVVSAPTTPLTITPPAKKLEEQFAIERLLMTHGKLSINMDNNVLHVTSLQLGAESINLQQDLFSFQLKAAIDYVFNQKHASTQLQFKGEVGAPLRALTELDALLKSIVLKGQLLLQNLQVDNFKINKLSANTIMKHGVISLNPLTLNLYQGEAIGDLNYNFFSKLLKINQTATGINSARFTAALFNQKLLQGKLDLSLHSQSNLSQDNWLNQTTGSGNISLHQGTLEIIDLNKVVKKLSNAISQNQENQAAPPLEAEAFNYPTFFRGTTPLKLMSIQYQLDHTLLSSDAIVLQTAMLQLKGDGKLSLTDYRLTSHLMATLTAEDDKISNIQQSLGGSFPLIIQGNLNHPTVLPDLKKINANLAKFWIKTNLVKPVLKIKDQFVSFFNH